MTTADSRGYRAHARRRAPPFGVGVFAIVLVAIAVRPAVFETGFWLDDHAHVAMREGRFPVSRSAFDSFNFSRGERDENAALEQAGFYPWFAHPRLGLSMLRPLSSALIAVDHQLFGRNAVAYHVHSAIWLAALMLVFALLLRREFGAPLAYVALLLFAVDEAPGRALGWIANRSHLVSATFALASLASYLRFRTSGARTALLAALACYAVALGVGEYALCFLGYFVAYELCAGQGPPRARAVALSGIVALACAYLAVRTLLAYGSYGSDMYLDPLRETHAFAAAAWARLSTLLSDLVLLSAWSWMLVAAWGGAAASVAGLHFDPVAFLIALSGYASLLGVVALFVAVGTGIAGMRAARASEGACSPRARRLSWWLLGSLFALLPLLASIPDPRLLVAVQLGWAVVVAAFLEDRWRALRSSSRSLVRRLGDGALVIGFVVPHAFVSLVASTTHAAHAADTAERTRRFILNEPASPVALARKRVVWANVEPISAVYFSLLRGAHGAEVPRSAWVLNPSPFPGQLTRTAPDRLELKLDSGSLFDGFYARTFRAHDEPTRPGATFALDGMRVVITEDGGHGPTAARFEFDRPLEDPIWVFLEATPSGWQPFRVPSIGETVQVQSMQWVSAQ